MGAVELGRFEKNESQFQDWIEDVMALWEDNDSDLDFGKAKNIP